MSIFAARMATGMAALTLLHSERPKLYTILGFLSATGLIKLRFLIVAVTRV